MSWFDTFCCSFGSSTEMREKLQEFNGPWMLSDKFCFKGSLILRAQGLGYFPSCFEILIVLASPQKRLHVIPSTKRSLFKVRHVLRSRSPLLTLLAGCFYFTSKIFRKISLFL